MKAFLVVATDEHDADAEAAFSLLRSTGMMVVELADNALTQLAALQVVQEPKRPKRTASGTQPVSGNGERPLHPGHVRHAWAPGSEPGSDHCMKCGMVRETLDKGVLRFTDRSGISVERPPFRGETPSCDEALIRKRRAMGI